MNFNIKNIDRIRCKKKKYIYSWIARPRKTGGQQKNYGHTILDALKRRGVDYRSLHKNDEKDKWFTWRVHEKDIFFFLFHFRE